MSSRKQLLYGLMNNLLPIERTGKIDGPTSPEGKAKVSQNALKTDLTPRTVLLPTDDAAAYQAHTEPVSARYSRETDNEHPTPLPIRSCLERIPRSGHLRDWPPELASQFADEQDEAVRKALFEAQLLLTDRRDLNNLSIQELRVHRQPRRMRPS
jgi:hypothetical protein